MHVGLFFQELLICSVILFENNSLSLRDNETAIHKLAPSHPYFTRVGAVQAGEVCR